MSIIKKTIDSSWNPVINLLFQEPLFEFVSNILPNISFQPQTRYIFKALQMPVNDIKVVILGTEPYPIKGYNLGYAFEVPIGTKIPFPNKVINRELNNQFPHREGFQCEFNTWTKQGVLLLNTALTVETGRPGSHLNVWREWTQRVISFLSKKNPCIWLLWGKNAQSFIPYINHQFQVKGYNTETIKKVPASTDFNYTLTATNPEINAAEFYGNNHFLFANEILSKTKNTKILW